MKLVVDGIIFQKDPFGGIARIYRETLPRLCDLEPGLTVHVFTDGSLQAELPAHPRILHRKLPAVRPTLRPRGVLRRVLYPLRRLLGGTWNRMRQPLLSDLREGIWQSTFYTLPEHWRGPQVVLLHDMIAENFQSFYSDTLDELGRQRKRRCIEQADHIICVSQSTRSRAKNWYNVQDERFSVVHLAASSAFRMLDADVEMLPAIPDEPFLLYVGSRAAHKNFRLLIDAFSRWEKRDRVLLVCAGSPWSAEEARLLEDRQISGRVRLQHGLADEQLCRLYNRALGLVYPSLEEGFGIPLLEAMACGCPIVASSIPSTIEVAGNIPITFNPESADDLCAGLDRLMAGDDLEIRRAAGLERARAFSWDKTARGMLAVYRTLLAE